MIVVFEDEVSEEILNFFESNRVEYKIIKDVREIDSFCVIVTEKERYIPEINKILAIISFDKIKILKWDIRFKVWRKMVRENIARPPFPIFGRIPNFVGSEKAAKNLLKIKEFVNAERVLVNPDSPQRPVRELVLKLGKELVVPTPKLKKGYLLIKNPRDIKEASTIKGIFRCGKPIKDLYVDFVVEGSVAVDLSGNRLGKGGGFGDIEIKTAREMNEDVKVATTVHEIQIVDKIPREEHDEKIDYIVTPNRSIFI